MGPQKGLTNTIGSAQLSNFKFVQIKDGTFDAPTRFKSIQIHY